MAELIEEVLSRLEAKGWHALCGIWRSGLAGTVVPRSVHGARSESARAPVVHGDRAAAERLRRDQLEPVSYTHLTLPTIYSV